MSVNFTLPELSRWPNPWAILKLHHSSGLYLEIRPKRYRCPQCEGRPTTTQRCDWYDPNSPHTKAFEKWVLRSLVNSTVVDVSLKLGLGPDAVAGILGRWVSTTVD